MGEAFDDITDDSTLPLTEGNFFSLTFISEKRNWAKDMLGILNDLKLDA